MLQHWYAVHTKTIILIPCILVSTYFKINFTEVFFCLHYNISHDSFNNLICIFVYIPFNFLNRNNTKKNILSGTFSVIFSYSSAHHTYTQHDQIIC